MQQPTEKPLKVLLYIAIL